MAVVVGYSLDFLLYRSLLNRFVVVVVVVVDGCNGSYLFFLVCCAYKYLYGLVL